MGSSSLPHFVLVAHASIPQSIAPHPAPAPALIHPTIHYHYADDPPIPNHPNTLLMDFDPADPSNPRVHSLSPNLIVSQVNQTRAPGVSPTADSNLNPTMYVVHTLAPPDDRSLSDSIRDPNNVRYALQLFEHRNHILRENLDYSQAQSKEGREAGEERQRS